MINARYQYIYQSKNTARAMLFDGTWLRFGYNRERAEALTSTTYMLALNFISVKVIHSKSCRSGPPLFTRSPETNRSS